MKIIVLVSIITFFISCKKESDQNSAKAEVKTISGQELFEGIGNCIACHQPNQKIIGPSMEEIATIYKIKKGSIVLFLKAESEPIVDPSQYEVMKTNFAITKSMSEEELKALEDYIYSFSK